MPFTFSHPAPILPVKSLSPKYISLTGFIAGSVAPDFEYFIRLDIISTVSHSFYIGIWLNLPIALIISFVFHTVIRNPVIHFLPHFIASKFHNELSFNWNKRFSSGLLIVLISTIAGVYSHIIWDSFTHRYGFFVRTIPHLSDSFIIKGIEITVYDILQHASSIIGLIIMTFHIKSLSTSREYKTKFSKNEKLFFLLIIIITLVSFIFVNLFAGLRPVYYKHIIIFIMTGFLTGLIISSFVFRKKCY